MSKNLVIVESPAKAKTIEGYLGNEFIVKSSYGHVRDLATKDLSIDVGKGFKPIYQVMPEKQKLIKELKKFADSAEVIWLATDEDREGEAISWHLSEVLKLNPEKTRRIVFHEITKTAITDAIKNPRSIDLHLVDAQQARRVLDRIVGFEISPILWKKVKPGLSAGRVQSVAVRLIVEREEEIRNFIPTFAFRVNGLFRVDNEYGRARLKAELNKRFAQHGEALDFLKKCINADFNVAKVEKKPAKRSPAPPFTTSTLQQEANRKLGFSVAKTMMVAQQLYEAGKITYMRTDSVHLSTMALGMAKDEITRLFGKEYHKSRQYATKSKGAQEAHEAIRPTYINHNVIEGDASQRKLYDLIWKRTIASQMADAQIEKTTVTINISTTPEQFISEAEVIKFDGFLKVYIESDDEENEHEEGIIPPLMNGEHLHMEEITAAQKYTQQPYRYNEASLVKKLEELGIGRPSTYAPTISTIQKREYVIKEDREGFARQIEQITLKGGKIKESSKIEKFGFEKAKLFPTDIGELVTRFLIQSFDTVMDYNFTANVEKEFDEIAQGLTGWNHMIREFYGPFHQKVTASIENKEKAKGEKLLGVDPVSGKNVYVKIGRFGPLAQIGESETEEKPRFAGLLKGQSLESITLSEALKLFEYPRKLGIYEGAEATVAIGRFGPYIYHNKVYYSLPKTSDPATITLEAAIRIILQKKTEQASKLIREFAERPDIKVINGRYGPYVAVGKENYKIPKSSDPYKLTLDDCLKLAGPPSAPATKKKTPRKSKKS